jgi:acyl-CoA synthetase (NDP forming)
MDIQAAAQPVARAKTELESKEFLKRHGIETTVPLLARSAREAAELAADIGAPLAMKIVSADIVHKAAAGGVRLQVAAEDAAGIFDEIMAACAASRPDAALEGVLLEKMAGGGLEVFLGARIDPEYGGVVLLGLGGSNVESGKAPAAMLAPVTRTLAYRLIDAAFSDVKGVALEAGAKERLADYLMAVAGPDGMLAGAEAIDLDINPIIVKGSDCIAVDAVVLPAGAGGASWAWNGAQLQRVVDERKARLVGMGALFEPASIAFIGASTATHKLGYRGIKNLIDFGYKGPIYPIHPSAPEICGQRAYASVLDVPGPVDRAYIAVGARHVPDMLSECARKGVKVVQVLTAGFTEWVGEHASEGAALEEKIRSVLAGTDMRMVGPNCIGTFSAPGRMSMGAARYNPTQTRGMTFISQSGTFAGDVVRRAQVLGVPVAQVLSCGNCSDLDLTDYLLFCESDPNTTLSAFYVESVRDPWLFFRVAAQAKKPIVLFKGGTTDQGMAAAGSHTAALATDSILWNAALRQAGILQVNSMADLMDTLLVCCAHTALKGNRLGIFGSGGGVSVTASDVAARTGMAIAPLAPATAQALQRFGVPGTSVGNPIDIPVWGLRDGSRLILGEIIDLLKADAGLDSIVVYVEMGSVMDFADSEADGLLELEAICASVAQAREDGPPVSLALRSTGDQVQEDFVRRQRTELLRRGIAVFASTSSAVQAHARLWALSGKEG